MSAHAPQPGRAPAVSVLVPTYNGARWVGPTLASILAQTFTDIEVLVSDDGSTDDTVAVLQAVAGDDPRVRIQANGNVGIFANPVRLLRQARGQLVKFVLQDDLLDPDCIARLAAPLLADTTLAMATSKRRRIDDAGRTLPDTPATTALAERSGRLGGTALGDHLLETQLNRVGELSTVLYRRSVLDPDTLWDFPGWKVLGNGDVVVHLKALAAGDCWFEAGELSAYRTHDAQYGAGAGVVIDCTVDWPHLLEGAKQLGFVRDPAVERRALTGWLRQAASVHAGVVDHERAGEVLDTLALAARRLRALGAADTGGADAERGLVAVGVAVLPFDDEGGTDLAPALARVVEPDSPIIECTVESTVEAAWDEILDACAELGGVEAVVLLRSDGLPVDAGLLPRVRARRAADPLAAAWGDEALDGLVVAGWAAGRLHLGR